MSTQVNLRSAPVLNPGKATYFKKQAISTLLGGFQFSDDESGIDLSYQFQGVQFILYIFFPLVVFICGLISNSNDFLVSGIVPGIINLIANLIVQIIGRQAHQKLNENRLLSSESTREFSMIIKAKSPLHIVASILLMGAVSFFAGNFIAKAPIGVQILTLINALVTFYSLVGGSPSEFSAMISDNTNPFTRHSTSLMRPMYMLIFLIINLAIDSNANQTTFHVLIPLLTLIYSLGLLSSVYTTLIYVIEKFNSYILGAAESTATDLRLILQTAVQILVIFIISIIAHSSYEKIEVLSKMRFIAVLTSILALILSMNFLFKLNVSSSGNKGIESAKLIYLIANKTILLISSIVLPIVFSQDQDTHSTGKVLCTISLIVLITNHIFQESQSSYFSSRLSSISSIPGRILNIVSQIIYLAAISQITINSQAIFSSINFTSFSNDSLSHTFVQTALIYRLFRSIYANPLITGIILSEIVIYSFIWDDSVTQLVIYSPILHAVNIAISNFFRRIIIWIYSILKMNSSKKQTIQNQSLFNILSFTLLLPVNLIGIMLSSSLDTPFLPALGLPLYFAGFPRPKRFWPDLKRVVRDAGESLLYEKFLDNFQAEFASILRKRNAQVGEFFLIRIEKYLATVQILEVGYNLHDIPILNFKSVISNL